MKTVSPNTYWTGQTIINNSEMDRYLTDTDQLEFLDEIVKAREQGLSDGEILCSFYAKACYSALTTKKNKNISKIRNIHDNVLGTIKSGHGCYDEHTEVMTTEGWVKWCDVSMDTIFSTINTTTGQMEWHKPSNILKKKYEGEMINYASNHVDLCVTPNHNMFVCNTTTKLGRKKQFADYKLIQAKEIINKSHAFLKCLPNEVTHLNVNPIYQLLGFTIGDGSLSSKYKIKFHLKRERKINYITDILTRIKDISYTIRRNELATIIVDISALPDEVVNIFNNIYNDHMEKIIPRIILNKEHSNTQLLMSLYDGLISSDGSVSKTSIIYDTTSKELSGQFQFLCNLISKPCNISQSGCYKVRKHSYGNKPIYRCTVGSRNKKPIFNQSSKKIYNKPSITQYTGMIYCAEVPNHTLFVRRNGKSVWCGNSVFEHCFLNFQITNCSRIFTHELVRHRVGTAFSQTSGRYVRTDTLFFVHDPILDNVLDDITDAMNYVENKYKLIEKKLDINNIKDFAKKKKLTSAMRRMLPNGQANEIGFSVNLRSLRHTITMRTSEHAEWEIRVIFNQIFDLVNSKYPAIFHDVKKEIKDGVFEISFENDI